jgi:hypothetical protein
LQLVTSGEDTRRVLRLCALGMRVEADEADRARAAGAAQNLEAALAAGAAMLEQVRDAAEGGAALPEARCTARLCEAEHARLEGRSEPELWEAAAAAWEELRQPYRAIYARWRQAEAFVLRDAAADAAAILRDAHKEALRVQAKPLEQQLELLARRSGIDLWRPATDMRR